MRFASGTALTFVFSAFLGLLLNAALPTAGFAFDDLNRTANRTPWGIVPNPLWLTARPDHYEFTPLVSNQDPQNQHPAAWDGQDWDSSQWGANWTPDVAVQKFFQARIFERQYMDAASTPVVELGPTFYKLSDLDRRRTLKLLTEQTAVFKKGHSVVELVDWSTHKIVGTCTPKGMFLN